MTRYKIYKMERMELMKYAKEILEKGFAKGKSNDDIKKEVKELAKKLADNNLYFFARELYYKLYISENPSFIQTEEDNQKISSYIYKDQGLSSDFKFDKSLEWLKKNIDIYASDQCETNGIAGSIYKRKAYYSKNISDFYTAKLYYEKGYKTWGNYMNTNQKVSYSPYNDFGYCAINLSFLLEKLAFIKFEETIKLNLSAAILNYLLQSKEINAFIIYHLSNNASNSTYDINPNIIQWHANTCQSERQKYNLQTDIADIEIEDISFIYATLIEALLGNGLYHFAKIIIVKYNNLKIAQWQKKTFIEQLKEIYVTKKKFTHALLTKESKHKDYPAIDAIFTDNFNQNEFEECLRLLYGLDKDSELPCFEGKAGLALSGGGFRAAYFHIGVLAALAENNKLKNIEVISCVSGGSIIGAYYYLYLKYMFESCTPSEITTTSYIWIVKNIINDFHSGVKNNIRMHIYSNLWANFKIAFQDNYTRTLRVAELYDKYLYSGITQKLSITRKDSITLRETTIRPQQTENFNARTDNFFRVHKIPQIILNATNLNSGHNFQFSSTWFGEPPFSINTDVDTKARYRRMYYEEAPPKYKNYPLSKAVGASSCVPAMFPAIEMKDLYKREDVKEKKVTKLVDGGVCDNQGLTAIIENECKVLYISDSSGQMQSDEFRERNMFGETYRSSGVSSERIREMQLTNAIRRYKEGFFETFHLLHLRKEINEEDLSWVGDNAVKGKIFTPNFDDRNTSYGIDKNLQKALSEIRTDLDSFSDTEAYALMYSGYLQTIKSLEDTEESVSSKLSWKFKTEVDTLFTTHTDTLTSEISIGKKMWGKWIYLHKLKRKRTFYLGLVLGLIVPIIIILFAGISYAGINDICLAESIKSFIRCDLGKLNINFIKFLVLILVFDTILGTILGDHLKKIRLWKLALKIPTVIILWIVFNTYNILVNKFFLWLGEVKRVTIKK